MSNRIMQRTWSIVALLVIWTTPAAPAAARLAPVTVDSSGRVAASPSPADDGTLAKVYDRLPLSFEANRGQFDERVRFVARPTGSTYFFTPQEVAIVFGQQSPSSASAGRRAPSSVPTTQTNSSEQWNKRSAEHFALKVRFVGASPNPRLEGVAPLPGYANYIIGNDPSQWQQGVPTYAGILYHDLYPQTDLRYKGVEGQPKYEFVLRPGAKVTEIALAYDGAEALRVNRVGQLEIQTPWGTLIEEAPLAWQEGTNAQREPVVADFLVGPGLRVGFAVGPYDPSRPLVIDPGLDYSTFVGGSNKELCHGMVLDSGGNVVVTGSTQSSSFPTTAGAYDGGHAGGMDVYVFKLSTDGKTLLNSTFVGGSNDEDAYGLTLDNAGNVWVAGYTWSSNFPTTPGAFDTVFGQKRDGFILKLSSDGRFLLYSAFVGGIEEDEAFAVALDGSGNPVVTGYTSSWDFPVTSGAFDQGFNGAKDVFVLKLAASGGGLVYSTLVGGSGEDIGRWVKFDRGDLVVAGYTWSSDFPSTSSAFDPTHNGGQDAWILKLAGDGSRLIYSSFLGGSGDERVRGLVLDGNNNPTVAGYTNSANFPTTSGAYDQGHNGANDVFISKVATDGRSLLYSTYVGGSSGDAGFGLALDSDGSPVVTGWTESGNFPTTVGAFDRGHNGSSDIMILKLAADGGSLLYSTFVGGTKGEQAHAVALAGTGNAVVAGRTDSSNFPSTNGAFDPNHNGDTDAFVLRLGMEDQPVECYTLTTEIRPIDGGSVLADPSPNCANDSSKYASGTQVQLTTTAASSCTFNHWSGDATGSAMWTTVTMTGNRSVTANFDCSDPPEAKRVFLPLVIAGSSSVPALLPISNPDGDGSYRVSWTAASGAQAYVLQEAGDSSFSSPKQIYAGPSTGFEVSGQGPTRYFYRVQGRNAVGSSPWSNPQWVDVLWEKEHNDSASNANGPLLSDLEYHGYPDDQKDYFYFHLGAPGIIRIDLSDHTGQHVQLQLFYRSTEDPVSLALQPPYHIEYPGQPGLYYIYINTGAGYNGDRPYTLRIVY